MIVSAHIVEVEAIITWLFAVEVEAIITWLFAVEVEAIITWLCAINVNYLTSRFNHVNFCVAF